MRVQRAERMWTTPSDRARGYSPPQVVNIGFPASVSEFVSSVDTAAPDSTVSSASRVVRSILLILGGYSATANGIRSLPRLKPIAEMQNSLFGFAAR